MLLNKVIHTYSSGFRLHSCGIDLHSGGFQWIPAESGHSCRNGRGSDKYCSSQKELTWSWGSWDCTWLAGFPQFLQFISISGPNSSEILIQTNQRQCFQNIQNLTFGLILRRTELGSLSSTSFSLIFLTTSASWVSVWPCRWWWWGMKTAGREELCIVYHCGWRITRVQGLGTGRTLDTRFGLCWHWHHHATPTFQGL